MPVTTLNPTAYRGWKITGGGTLSEGSTYDTFVAGKHPIGFLRGSMQFTLPSDFFGASITTATLTFGALSLTESGSSFDYFRSVLGIPANSTAFASQDVQGASLGSSRRFLADQGYVDYSTGNPVDHVVPTAGTTLNVNVKAMMDEAMAAGRFNSGLMQLIWRFQDSIYSYGDDQNHIITGTTIDLYLDYTPTPLFITAPSTTFRVGGGTTLTVRRNGSTAGDLIVSLAQSPAGRLTLFQPVTIPSGQTSEVSPVIGLATGTTTLTATAGSDSYGLGFNVLPALPAGLGDETHWYCPSLDSTGNGTTTVTDLVETGAVNGALTDMDAATDWPADTGNGGVRALDFDGSNDRITFASPISPSGSRSISMWVRFNNPTNRQGLIGTRSTSGNQGFVFLLNATNTLRYFHTGGGDLSATATFVANTWYQLGVTFAGNTVRLYRNGVQIATSTSFANDTASVFNGVLGAEDQWLSGPFAGRIDDARIYNRELTNAEMAHLASLRGVLGVPSAPLNLWTPARITTSLWLDASDATTLFDATSGGSQVSAGGSVARWQDKSGNTRHASQATSGSRPVRQAGSLNGRDGVLFDGSNDFLDHSGSGISTGDAKSVFVVARGGESLAIAGIAGGGLLNHTKLPASGDPRYLFRQLGQTNGSSYIVGGDTVATNAITTHNLVAEISTAFLSGWIITTARATNWWLNGTPRSTSGMVNSESAITGYRIGAAMYGTGELGEPWPGPIYEIVAINGEATTAVRERIEGYLAHKWGLAGLLPSNHPFKTIPPLADISRLINSSRINTGLINRSLAR
jgi:hypothetical protein